LKGVGVAEGEAHIYAGPGRAGKRWDVCAPEAIVRAAGGEFTEALGKPFDYRDEDLTNHGGILAAASALHQPMLERLRELKSQAS
jgi:3'(2'), 5'-bisphosphate nucleotidase